MLDSRCGYDDVTGHALLNAARPRLRIYRGEEFRALLAREIQRAGRYQEFLSLCLARPAYAAAPRNVLMAIAQRAAESLRSSDIIGVLDDLVAILLVHTPDSDAVTIIERLQSRLESETFRFAPGAPEITSTVSLGLASFPTDGTEETVLVEVARTRLVGAGGSE
jgi:diguanylate cyclase with GGDEF domain